MELLTSIFHREAAGMECRSCSIKEKSSSHAQWWDQTCEEAKKIKRAALNAYRTNRHEYDLEFYLQSKRSFKNICQTEERDYKRSLFDKLHENSHDSTIFWKHINAFKKTTSNTPNISTDHWFEYFSALLNNMNNEPEEFDEIVTNDLNAHADHCDDCIVDEPSILNRDITTDEIKGVLKELPDGKSPGIDGIVY